MFYPVAKSLKANSSIILEVQAQIFQTIFRGHEPSISFLQYER
jgi:hypothetical protein